MRRSAMDQNVSKLSIERTAGKKYCLCGFCGGLG